MKNIVKYALVLSLAFVLTGCFPTGEVEQQSSIRVDNAADSSDSEPAAFAIPNDLQNVKFNLDLSETGGDYPSEVPVIKAKRRQFDVEEAKAMFIDGKTVIKETPNDYGGAFHTSDGITLSVNQFGLYYAVNHLLDDEEKHSLFSVKSNAALNLRYNYSDYQHLDAELDGFSRAEALARADELVNKLDIKFLGEPNVYAFTLEELENYINKPDRLDKEGNETSVQITKNDEFYLVRYFGEYGGVTMPGEIGQVFENEFQDNTQVDVILTSDSLMELSCDDVFDSIEAIEATQIKCGAETAASKAYDYYSSKDRVMDYQLEYNNLALSYVTFANDYNAGEVTFKPLWHLSGRQYYTTNGISGDVYADKFVDPATGIVFDAGL